MLITHILMDITEDMDVIDSNGVRIGKVKFVQPAEHMIEPSLADFPYDLQSKHIPTELAYQLLSSGFISVKAGWWAKDRIARAEEIEMVLGDQVYLNVSSENLVNI